MKKIIPFILALCLLLLSIPIFADAPQWIPPGSNIQWPPPQPTYDIPAVAYDVNWLQIITDSFRISIKAVASKGFWIMMLFTVVAAIPDIFHMFYFDQIEINKGVRRRMLNRRVKAADLNRNKGEILAEKVRDMEVQNEAQQMFRMLNSEKLIHQRVRQMEANAEATEIFKRENAGLISKRRIADMERNFLDRKAFKRQNRIELMSEKRFDMQEGASARELYEHENHDIISQRKLTKMRENASLRKTYEEEHSDEVVAAKMRAMESSREAKGQLKTQTFESDVDDAINRRIVNDKAEAEYHALYPDAYSEKRDLHHKLAQDYYDRRNGK